MKEPNFPSVDPDVIRQIDPGIKVLDEAARILRERGWTQGKMISNTGEVCMLGAVCIATTGAPCVPDPGQVGAAGYNSALVRLTRIIDKHRPWTVRLSSWNDSCGRDLQQVLDLIERAKEGPTP